MASVNKVILVGNLGRDPEMRYTPDGTAICQVSLATTSQWKDKSTGERREETEWHRVVFYNRLAEVVGEYLRKGRSMYVEGRIKTRKWQDKETGQDKYSTEIIGESMQMLGGRDDSNQGAPAPQQQRQPQQQRPQNQNHAPQNLADMDDDIPLLEIESSTMADEIDRASDMQQVMLDSLIAAQRNKAAEHKPSPAECLNECGEPPMPGGSFCSRECKEDFDYRQMIRQRQGLA